MQSSVKKLYANILNSIYLDKNQYKFLKTCKTEPLNRIKAFLKKLKLKQRNEDFPCPLLIPKFHKNPVTFGTITCDFGSYLVDVNKALLNILKVY